MPGVDVVAFAAAVRCGAAMPRGGCLPRRHQGRERAGDVVELALPRGLRHEDPGALQTSELPGTRTPG